MLHAVDDASGRVFLRFVPNENTEEVLKTLKKYVEENGIPHSIYTDKFKVYYAEDKQTDFQKAMDKLSIRRIYANSPQAKGRVERGNRTLQDCLVKEMRLRGISDIDSANKFLREEFIDYYNNKFSIKDDLPDVHTSSEGIELENVFCRETKIQVRNDYTVTLNGKYIQLEKSEVTLPLPKQYVTLRKYLDGSLHIFHNEDELKFKILNGKPRRKRVKVSWRPAENHPWRNINFGKNRRK